MREIHKGVCRNHAGGAGLSPQGTPTRLLLAYMKKDAAEFIRRCDKCQGFSSYTKSHPETLNFMVSPWPFVVWGIDIIEVLPAGK